MFVLVVVFRGRNTSVSPRPLPNANGSSSRGSRCRGYWSLGRQLSSTMSLSHNYGFRNKCYGTQPDNPRCPALSLVSVTRRASPTQTSEKVVEGGTGKLRV